MQYTNRKDDTYYLQAGKTRTGKPRYWCGRKLTGEPLDAVPEGYEIREDPASALVTLRLARRTDIAPPEIELLSRGIREMAGLEHFIVDVEGNSLVVYLPDMANAEADHLLELFGHVDSTSPRTQNARDYLMRTRPYTAMMRFSLVDPDERLFVVDRWCFRGSIDDWIGLSGRGPLPALINKFVPHLGKESFYELI